MKILVVLLLCFLSAVCASPRFGSSEERFGFGFGGFGRGSSESFYGSGERFRPGYGGYGGIYGGYNQPFSAFPFANT